jgi:SAM-dependent methyltransferase/uncharacterized protein YbaR (Trm112 family)
MHTRLLSFLRCPQCGGSLDLVTLTSEATATGTEVSEGLLRCESEHWFPIIGGIPRMLPEALADHWAALEAHLAHLPGELSQHLSKLRPRSNDARVSDPRTRASFTQEWRYHELGGRTWGMELDHRVKTFFLEPLRIPRSELRGKLVLDAGCGNGSQSVAYTEFGVEVIAVDLTTSVEKGQAYRSLHANAVPEKVHFIQGDLQRPPVALSTIDVIHSAGVLHHTSDTLQTFRALCPLLRSGGTFYVWLYKYEPYVTPLVNSIRTVTTRIPADTFARIARVMARPFIWFTTALDALGIRKYERLTTWEAAVALIDIFGSPYAHYHSFEEVAHWFREEGFKDIWPCTESRRGFGVCGRLPVGGDDPD